jgi:hypothetical protein
MRTMRIPIGSERDACRMIIAAVAAVVAVGMTGWVRQ